MRPTALVRITLLQRRSRAAPRRKPGNGAVVLPAKHEFNLPELIRLETACRLKAQPEGEELERCHRFENVELRNHHLEDGENPLQSVLRAGRVIVREQTRDAAELVEQFLEPELAHLVDDDEEHLIVLGAFRPGLLQ